MKARAGLGVVLVLAVAAPAGAYLHLGITTLGGQPVRLRWTDLPVRWYASDAGVPGISASEAQAAFARAFATWQAVPSATVAFSFGGFTGAPPFDEDGITVLGFAPRPDLERVLGATSFLIDVATGEILEADVFFNSVFPWSVSAAGEPDRIDLESVAVHEIGHVLGLGHSALGETEAVADGRRRVLGSGSVMFPIALGRGVIADRTLQPDDIAAVSDLYPADRFQSSTGSIRGRVRRGGIGVPGAHVVAFNPFSGVLVGGFALTADGDFQIAGLAPGAYILRVEPLDDADVDSFFGRGRIDVDFQVTFHPRLVAAPAGGSGAGVDVEVRPK